LLRQSRDGKEGVLAHRGAYFCLALFVVCCGGRTSLAPGEVDDSTLSGRGGGAVAGTSFGGLSAAGGGGGRMGAAGARPMAGANTGALGGGGASSGTAGQAPITAGAGGDAGEAFGGAGGASPVTPAAIGVAVGAFHSCALFEGGSVRCWGSSQYTGYGDDREPLFHHLPSVAGDVDVGGVVTSLSASWYHTCAIVQGGALRCWGSDYRGKLGRGKVADFIGDDETPASAGDIDLGGVVVQVAPGPAHTCAVLVGGNLRCWGSNQYGALGYVDPQDVGDDEVPAAAGDVPLGSKVLQVATNSATTCVVLVGGNVRCWGNGWPVAGPDIELGGAAQQVVTGLHFACALLDTGKVRCWGYSPRGQLGYGNTSPVTSPARAGDVDVGGQVTHLTADQYGACALLSDGAVRCWGVADTGELGYANLEDIGDDETPAAAGDVDVGGPVAQLDMGFLNTCGVLAGGTVRCWGRGATGALGYGGNEVDIGDDETPASAGDILTH
jgi:alpha-tubulin suppressor-like RCC1 family protein